MRQGVRPFAALYLSLKTRLLDGSTTHVAGPSGAPAHRRATVGPKQAAASRSRMLWRNASSVRSGLTRTAEANTMPITCSASS